jgi:hypothetical protein
MIPDVTIPVERFHRVLVDEIQKQRPTYLDNSFTVAEIYQILVPYRSHRDALGVEMNGDYEDALLRLLAGAGELVVLESDDARSRILKELQSKNPNTGLFREFAGAGVHLNPEGLPNSMRGNGAAGVAPVDIEPAPESNEVEPDGTPSTEDGFVAGAISPAAVSAAEPQAPPEREAAPEPQAPLEREAAPESEPAPSSKGLEATYFDFETSSLESIETEAKGETQVAEADIAPEVSKKSDGVVNGAAPTEEDAETSRPISLVSATETPTAEPGAGFWKPGEHPVNTTTMSESSTGSSARASVGSCLWCTETLPDRGDVKFCPHCGVNTAVKPCGGCRAEMEASWKFCISCGTKAS